MRYKISGGIGILWGGFILFNFFTGDQKIQGDGAYQTGQYIGLGFGVLLFGAGLYYVTKSDEAPSKKKKKKAKPVYRRPVPPPEL